MNENKKMAMKHLTWALPVLAGLAVLEVAMGQIPAATTAAASEYVEAHNRARAEVGVEPLRWNQTLANLADVLVQNQRTQKGCDFAMLRGNRYGANQMWVKGQAVAPRAVVEEWVRHKAFYRHASNSCVKGHNCEVYTQLVWRDSVQVGCAQATCQNEGITLTICHYKPGGNIVGEAPY